MTSTHDPFTGPGPHIDPDGAAAGETGPEGLNALPGWLRRAVLGWGVRRSPASWVGGVLGGVAERYRIDPLLARGVFVAVCMISAGLGLLAYAAAWAVLPDADGRVQFGRLRRGEWQDATVAIGVIGAIGALNLLLGAGLNLFEVTTLGQPLEVMKTTMAANRKDGMAGSVARIWSRGGVFGCKLILLAIL